MTTTESNPAYLLCDSSSLARPEPFELEKPYVSPTPPNAHTLSLEEALLASVVVNPTPEDGTMEKSQEHDIEDPSIGEHGADDAHPPSSPRGEGLERSPIAHGIDSAKLNAVVDLPGDLPKPTHHSILGADEGIPPAAEIGEQATAAMASQRPGHPATRPRDRVNGQFSLSGLPTLQSFIPDELFPDELLVYDPDNVTKLRRRKSRSPSDVPVRYVRIFPNLKAPRQPFLPYGPETKAAPESLMPPQPALLNRSPHEPLHVAHLYLKANNELGVGNHSSVFSAPLRLRLNPASREESTVRVAAKTASGSCGAHKMLHMEAGVYDAFPRHLMDDRYVSATAPAAAPTVTEAQPPVGPQVDATAQTSPPRRIPTSSADGQCTVAAHWIEPAVVPKFFGYYAAVAPDGSVIMPQHVTCDPDARCAVSWPTRILLVEECGRPIFPQLFSQEQKLRCLQLVKRLHAAGFVQNSMYVRNILVQPGPLAALPSVRSYATPSFRIIDFGRGVVLSHLIPGFQLLFSMVCESEERKAVHYALELCAGAARGQQCAQVQLQPSSESVNTVLCMLHESMLSLHWLNQEHQWVLRKVM